MGFTCIIGLGIVLSAIGLGYGLSERNAAQERLRQVAERAAELQKVADMEALQSKSLRYANSMLAANEAFDRGRRETNLQLLANCPEDQRGIEWQWMNHLAADQTQPLMVSSKEHSLTALAYGPDGRWIISAGVDGTLRQFNPDSRRELRSWLASDSAIRCISIDPDGSFVACGNESGQLSLWNLETAQRLAIHQFPSSITVCAIDIETPTGAGERRFSISAGCQNGHVYEWKLNVANPTEQPPNSIFKLSGQIHSLQYSKDKKRLLAAGKGGVVLLNLEQSGQSLSTGQFWQSYKALFSTDDTVVFFGPPELVAYSLTNESETIFEVPSAGISAATYAAKDHSIILATDDQALRRISLQNGDQETIGYCHAGAIQQLATYGSGDQIAMVLSDGSLRTLNRDSFAAPYTIRAFDHELSQLTAESLESVYALSERGELVAWNALTGVETFRRKIHELQGFSISLRAAQRELITLGLDQRMVFQSTQPESTGEAIDVALGARFIALHPNGDWLAGPMPAAPTQPDTTEVRATSNADANLALWDLESRTVRRKFHGLSNWAMQLRFSNDGNRLAAATISDGAVVWHMDKAEAIHYCDETPSQIDQVAFSADDQFLFAAEHNGQVCVWEIASAQLMRKMVCHGDQLSAILVTADGSRIITACTSDSILRVWDWRRGQKVAEFETGLDGVIDLKLVDQESSLLIGGKHGQIRYLRLGPQ